MIGGLRQTPYLCGVKFKVRELPQCLAAVFI